MRVFIMRGLPGSGKSTWVRDHVVHSHTSIQIVSADSYHLVTEDGKSVYRFKSENAKAAHDSCLREYLQNLNERHLGEIIVDNTNLSAWEIAPYYRVAEALGHEVEIVHCVCSPSTSLARNTHSVPEGTILKMAARIDTLPPWWQQTLIYTDTAGSSPA